jgi:tight adherence protein C
MVVDAAHRRARRGWILMIALLGSTPAVLAAATVALAGASLTRVPTRRPGPAGSSCVSHEVPSSIAAAGGVRRPRSFRIVALGGGALAALVLAGPIGAVLVVIGSGLLRRWRLLRARRRAARRVEEAVPELIDLLVVAVRGGFPPSLAFELLAELAPAPVRPGVVDVVRHHRAGARFADALGALVARCGPALEPLSSALARVERYGDPLAPVLEQLAGAARAQRRRAAEAAARVLPVRLCFPLVCCTLPAFVLLAIVPLLGGAFSSLRAGTAP